MVVMGRPIHTIGLAAFLLGPASQRLKAVCTRRSPVLFLKPSEPSQREPLSMAYWRFHL